MCHKPCPSCPYKKTSIPNYFGGQPKQVYADAIQVESIVACHSRSSYNSDGDVTNAVPCIGHVAAQIKSCKTPNGSNELLAKTHAELRIRSDYEQILDNSLSIFDFDKHHDQQLTNTLLHRIMR